MKSFGSLLRKLRAETPVTALGKRIGIPKSYLANLEAGRKIPTEKQARRILARGFGLSEEEVSRCILHVLLYDYGLREEALRELVVDLVRDPELLESSAALGDLLSRRGHKSADGLSVARPESPPRSSHTRP